MLLLFLLLIFIILLFILLLLRCEWFGRQRKHPMDAGRRPACHVPLTTCVAVFVPTRAT